MATIIVTGPERIVQLARIAERLVIETNTAHLVYVDCAPVDRFQVKRGTPAEEIVDQWHRNNVREG